MHNPEVSAKTTSESPEPILGSKTLSEQLSRSSIEDFEKTSAQKYQSKKFKKEVI